jgi:hypothetical protein
MYLSFNGNHNNTVSTLSERPTFPLKSVLSRCSRISHFIAITNLMSGNIFLPHEPIVLYWYSRMFQRGCTEHVNTNLVIFAFGYHTCQSNERINRVRFPVWLRLVSSLPSPDRLWIYTVSCEMCSVVNFPRDSAAIFSNWLLPTDQIIPVTNATDALAQNFVANDEFPPILSAFVQYTRSLHPIRNVLCFQSV